METLDLEQRIAMAWAQVELDQMHIDTATTPIERQAWESRIADDKLKWVRLIEELDRIHGGAGAGGMRPDYMALVFGFVLVMMACLGIAWSVLK